MCIIITIVYEIVRLLDLGFTTQNTPSFSLSLSFDTLLLNLVHELTLNSVLLLLCRILHRIFSSLDLLLVLPVLAIGTAEPVPPAEGGGVVVGEGHMVKIVVVSTGPEGNDVLERPGEVWIQIVSS